MGAFARLLLAAAALLTACSFGNGAKSFSEDGVSFRYPEVWDVAGFSTTNSPHRLAVASYPLPDDAVEGDCGGYQAVELLPPEGALVLVIDYGPAGSFPERPPEFALHEGEYAEYECFGPSTMFRFRVGDRDFQAHVALGTRASDAMREQALAILESIAVEEPERFVPDTRRDGDRLVMPLTFPDGTTAELIYPVELGLERFTIRPYGSGKLANAVARDFFVVEGDVRDVLARMNDDAAPALLAVYEDARGGKVGLWDVGARMNVNYLGFQFGRWAVLVYDYKTPAWAMTDAERAAWVRGFSGFETDGGWLVLEGSGRLRLARAGEHAGPRLSFEGAAPVRSLELVPGRCRPHRNEQEVVGRALRRGGYASWCLTRLVRIHVSGPRPFVSALIRALAARDVALVG